MKDAATILSPTELRFERLLPGPIETIWAFLTDARKRGEWFAAGPMDLRVGGRVELNFKHSDLSPLKAPPPERLKEMDAKGHQAIETITEIDPPRHLAFTFHNSEVVFDLVPKGDKILLILTHRKLPSRDQMVGVAGGWQSHLEVLTEKAHGRVPRAFWDIFRESDGQYDGRIPK